MGRWLPWEEIDRRQRAADRYAKWSRRARLAFLIGSAVLVWAAIIAVIVIAVTFWSE